MALALAPYGTAVRSVGAPAGTTRGLSTQIASGATNYSRVGLANSTIDDLIADPALFGDHSPADLMAKLNAARINYTTRATTGTVKTGTVFDIAGHSTLRQLRFHPGGARHAGSYWTVSGSQGLGGTGAGKIHIFGPKFRLQLGQRAPTLPGHFTSDP